MLAGRDHVPYQPQGFSLVGCLSEQSDTRSPQEGYKSVSVNFCPPSLGTGSDLELPGTDMFVGTNSVVSRSWFSMLKSGLGILLSSG